MSIPHGMGEVISPNGSNGNKQTDEFDIIVETGGESFGYIATRYVRRGLGSVAANVAQVKTETNGHQEKQVFPNLPPELSKLYEELYRAQGILK
jgi:hypothetical protein